MAQALRNYLSSKATFTDAELAQVEAKAVAKKLKRREHLLHSGEVGHYIAFVVRGCLRLYRTDGAAEEHVLRFAIENWWITDAESFRTGQPAAGAIDALEDTEVPLWSKEDFDQLKGNISAFGALER